MTPVPSSSFQIHCIDSTQAFEALRPAWQDLLAHSQADSVFLTWEWLYTWWKTKGEPSGRRLWMLTAWQDDILVGVAPLMLERQRLYGINLRVLRSLGGVDIDVGGIILRQNAFQTSSMVMALCQELVNQSRQWDALLLEQFPQEDPATQAILAAFGALGLITRVKTESHLYLPIQGNDWTTYLGRLSGNMRRNWKRSVRRAEQAGGYTFANYVGQEVSQDHLVTIFSINETGRYPELYRDPQERAFQCALLDMIAPLGWLHLSLLTIHERPVAFIYSLIYNGKYEAWRAGFEQAYAELSVGKLTMIHMIEDCFQRQYREIDFLRGDETYKTHLHTKERPYYWQIWAAPRWKPLALWVTIGLPRIKTWVKSRLKKEEESILPPPAAEDK